MFAPSCWLRPSDIAGHLPVPDNGAANPERDLVFPSLMRLWQETHAFDITTNATTEESVVSPLIYGPFVITEIGFRSGSAGGASQLLRLGVADHNTNPTSLLDTGSGTPGRLTTDSVRTVAAFYATTVFERHKLNQEFHQGTARLIWMLNNTTAAGVTVVGHVTIAHCAYRDAFYRSTWS